MLTYTPIDKTKPGTLYKMLLKSYSGMFSEESDEWICEKKKWKQFDKNVFDSPDTVGSCTFLTFIGKDLVGFASYDPRNAPEYGIVGQSCILPAHRGHGYGKLQIEEVLRRLKEKGVRKAKVTTGSGKFFIPAQKMYKSLGFKEVSRENRGDGYNVVSYEREL